MSVATPQTPPPPAVPVANPEIIIISHSNLFYWWSVWLLGFILGLLTYFGHHVMAIVPGSSEQSRTWKVENAPDTFDTREGIILPKNQHLPPEKNLNDPPDPLKLHISGNKSFGVIFIGWLLLVIFVTNVPLRGMWSMVAIMLLIMAG